MRQTERSTFGLLSNHLVVGAVVVAVTVIGVIVAYSAQTGLPFVPVYRATINIPDATRVNLGAPVRIGGAQVGIVRSISAVAATREVPAHAAVEIAIRRNLGPLPIDTTVVVRPISILGGKYLALTIGRSRTKLAPGQSLPLSQAIPTVDFDDALRIFAPPIRRALTATIIGYGDGLAGRGSALNDAFRGLNDLLPPAERVSALLAEPQTNLSGFISGSDAFARALAPVNSQFAQLFTHGGPALQAFRGDNGALAANIRGLPPAERTIDAALDQIDPVLSGATVIAQRVHPGTRLVATFAADATAALHSGIPPLAKVPQASKTIRAAMGAFDRVALDPNTYNAFRLLTRAVESLAPTLAFLVPAQTVCNVLGIYARNVASAYSEGDANGAWERQTAIYETNQDFQEGSPDPDLHDNYYPIENATQCEAGNEPYLPGQHIGNVPTGTTVDHTSPPPDATQRAAAAGLLAPVPGAAR